MRFYDSKGNECDITETDGGYEEAYVVSAQYLDESLSAEVPDSELEYLSKTYYEHIADEEYQKLVMKAEYTFEGDR
jgi:hypothetical protein